MNKIWETNGLFNNVETQARIVDMDGDKILEVIMPKDKMGLWKRLKLAVQYVLGATSLGFGHFYLDEDDLNNLSKIGGEKVDW